MFSRWPDHSNSNIPSTHSKIHTRYYPENQVQRDKGIQSFDAASSKSWKFEKENGKIKGEKRKRRPSDVIGLSTFDEHCATFRESSAIFANLTRIELALQWNAPRRWELWKQLVQNLLTGKHIFANLPRLSVRRSRKIVSTFIFWIYIIRNNCN